MNVYLIIITGPLDQIRRITSRETMVLVLCWNLHHSGVGFNECSVVPQTQSLAIKTLGSHSYLKYFNYNYMWFPENQGTIKYLL